MAPQQTRESRLPVSGTAITYKATIRVVGFEGKPVRPTGEYDDQLAKILWDDKDLRARLDRQARDLFGEGFRAVLLDVSSDGSVHMVVALYVQTRVIVEVVAFREKAAAFAQSIRDAIKDVGGQGLYDLVIDVEPQEPILPAPPGAVQAQPAPWDRVSAVLAAVATGIGVLGFVAFVGGAIEFARLSDAGLPAEEALAVIPNANLIAIGAHVLVPALLLAAIAAFLLYLWQLAVSAYYRFGSATTSTPDSSSPRNVVRGVLLHPGGRAVALAVLFFAIELYFFFTTYSGQGFPEVVAFIALAAVTSGAVFVVSLRSRTFLWVAATAFAAAAIFASVLAYARISKPSQVRPAAVESKGNTITGFFIAETASQIYLGRTQAEWDKEVDVEGSRIFILPKDEVSDVAIGPLMDPPDAYPRSLELVKELCSETVSEPLSEIEKKPDPQRTECGRALLTAP
jgi:hypothetical protein